MLILHERSWPRFCCCRLFCFCFALFVFVCFLCFCLFFTYNFVRKIKYVAYNTSQYTITHTAYFKTQITVAKNTGTIEKKEKKHTKQTINLRNVQPQPKKIIVCLDPPNLSCYFRHTRFALRHTNTSQPLTLH